MMNSKEPVSQASGLRDAATGFKQIAKTQKLQDRQRGENRQNDNQTGEPKTPVNYERKKTPESRIPPNSLWRLHRLLRKCAGGYYWYISRVG